MLPSPQIPASTGGWEVGSSLPASSQTVPCALCTAHFPVLAPDFEIRLKIDYYRTRVKHKHKGREEQERTPEL